MARRLALTLAASAVFFLVCTPECTLAAESIPSIDSYITVNPDASIAVVEIIQYDFADTPNRHGIYREIPLSFISADGRSESTSISDVTVSVSNAVGEDPVSVLYQVSTTGDIEHIRVGDPGVTVSGIKTYSISYTVHGAITLYQDFDELYWNATGDKWALSIASSSATINLPSTVATGDLHMACYAGVRGSKTPCDISVAPYGDITRVSFFKNEALVSGEGLTIAVGFPKGLVSYPLPVPWWRAWGLTLIAAALLLLAIAYAVWRVRSERAQGRGTIIPIYEPPQDLRPAEADVLVHGKLSQRSWPSTVVDLAVRGFVRITEVEGVDMQVMRYLGIGVILLVLLVLIPTFAVSLDNPVAVIAGLAIITLIVGLRFSTLKTIFRKSKGYMLTRVSGTTIVGLKSYEQGFLTALFAGGDTFSTVDIRKDVTRSHALYQAITKLEDGLYAGTEADTAAYDRDPERAKKSRTWFYGALGVLLIAMHFFFKLDVAWFASADETIAGILLLVALCVAIDVLLLRARLNPMGAKEREDWLGFKLYLETAEKYRLQDLTPDTFQKFLPYAMVFGIEKKWAKAFENIAIPVPGWYSGSAANATAFSASGFTSSFSSSFSSSFASSGAGGASGGGGGAGGGGGGGGGGGW